MKSECEMKILNYNDKNLDAQVLCLGFFDCIHKGHLKLITKAKSLANKYNAKVSLFTFSNNPLSLFSEDKLIFTFSERCFALNQLNIDYVYKAEFDKEFSKINAKDFLDLIIKDKNIKAIVCGEDYTFGYKKEGNVEFLSKYCMENNIELSIVDIYKVNGEKIASRVIRKLVEKGSITQINANLSSPYIIQGKVISGKGIGHKDLYPTANIQIDSDKVKLGEGVYFTQAIINGVRLRSVTNVGVQPTVNGNSYQIETYIIYYNKDLYGKEITLEFIERLRDIKKFNSKIELKMQIEQDINYVCSLNGGYD